MVRSCCSRNHPGPSIHDLTIHHEQLGIHQQDCFFCTQKESGVHGNLRNGTLITSQCPYKKWITAETNHWTLVLRKFPTENLGSLESTKHCVLGDMLRPSQSPELPQFLVGGWPTPLNMSSSVGMMKFPYMESHKIPWFQTTNEILSSINHLWLVVALTSLVWHAELA